MADCSTSRETDEAEPQNAETQTEGSQHVFSSVPVTNIIKPKTAETQTENPESQQNGGAPNKDFFNTDDKISFYTGLPKYAVVKVLLDQVAPFATPRITQSLDNFQEFMIVLMKLKRNMEFQDLAFWFRVPIDKVKQIFYSWMVVLGDQLSCLVFWPNREVFLSNMPMFFKETFGQNKTVTILDCFEIFIDEPETHEAREQTFSSEKNRYTLKVLIGITPRGFISFVSKPWGGCASNRFLLENCGLLDNLLPGDIVLATCGDGQQVKTVHAFSKGEAQLDTVDLEGLSSIARVRMLAHVEQLIGHLQSKYTFLKGTVPIDYLDSDESEEPLIERITRVCATLVNICPPIVSFD